MTDTADLILFNGKITTLDLQKPEAEALAIRDGRFMGAASAQEIMRFAGPSTQRIDLKSRRVDGVRSLADAMRMLKEQVAHSHAWTTNVPLSDARSFWGALGCSCWVF